MIDTIVIRIHHISEKERLIARLLRPQSGFTMETVDIGAGEKLLPNLLSILNFTLTMRKLLPTIYLRREPRSDFEDANLEGANLIQSSFWNANLKGCILKKTSLRNDIRNIITDRTNFENTHLESANLEYTKLGKVNFKGACFEAAKATGVKQTANTCIESNRFNASRCAFLLTMPPINQYSFILHFRL